MSMCVSRITNLVLNFEKEKWFTCIDKPTWNRVTHAL